MSANRLTGLGMVFLVALLVSGESAQAGHARLLYGFKHGGDGYGPASELIVGGDGAVYGTTQYGGAYNYGTVFELLPTGKESLLHEFTGGADGGGPESGLVADGQGNLYGTTLFDGPAGAGTLYKIAPDGSETVLHGFAGGSDGGNPFGRPLIDSKGNLFGTTTEGGGIHCGDYGCGTVYKVTPSGEEKILYSFLGSDEGNGDGESPEDSLIQDKAGNLYGTTIEGGVAGWGTVFMVSPKGQETVLHRFSPSTDGGLPVGGLVTDKAGNMYGTTACCGANNGGVVFKVTPEGSFSVVHAFAGGSDGMAPYGLTIDGKGDLYGTTVEGGGTDSVCPNEGCGTIFKIAPDGTENIVYSFTDGKRGVSPLRSPLVDAGYIYATAEDGGTQGLGTVIKVKR
jgi:uncharacterized repeat protein (TIGR03803 family)